MKVLRWLTASTTGPDRVTLIKRTEYHNRLSDGIEEGDNSIGRIIPADLLAFERKRNSEINGELGKVEASRLKRLMMLPEQHEFWTGDRIGVFSDKFLFDLMFKWIRLVRSVLLQNK